MMGETYGLLIPENSCHGLAATRDNGLHIHSNIWVVNTLPKVNPTMFSMLFIKNFNPEFAALYA
jgi:hypothetical protein